MGKLDFAAGPEANKTISQSEILSAHPMNLTVSNGSFGKASIALRAFRKPIIAA
jgi:hypothetical protein